MFFCSISLSSPRSTNACSHSWRHAQEDDGIEQEVGDKIMFMIAGLAIMTLLINGTTCGKLLSHFHMDRATKVGFLFVVPFFFFLLVFPFVPFLVVLRRCRNRGRFRRRPKPEPSGRFRHQANGGFGTRNWLLVLYLAKVLQLESRILWGPAHQILVVVVFALNSLLLTAVPRCV